MGSGKWQHEHGYWNFLVDANVVLIPDKDKADPRTGRMSGIDHAVQIAEDVQPTAKSVRWLDLPSGSKDITDWATRSEKHGMGDAEIVERLKTMIRRAPQYFRGIQLLSRVDRDILSVDLSQKSDLDWESMRNQLIEWLQELNPADLTKLYRDLRKLTRLTAAGMRSIVKKISSNRSGHRPSSLV